MVGVGWKQQGGEKEDETPQKGKRLELLFIVKKNANWR